MIDDKTHRKLEKFLSPGLRGGNLCAAAVLDMIGPAPEATVRVMVKYGATNEYRCARRMGVRLVRDRTALIDAAGKEIPMTECLTYSGAVVTLFREEKCD